MTSDAQAPIFEVHEHKLPVHFGSLTTQPGLSLCMCLRICECIALYTCGCMFVCMSACMLSPVSYKTAKHFAITTPKLHRVK